MALNHAVFCLKIKKRIRLAMTYSPGGSPLRVPSALAGLTAGFGMEPGISPPHKSPVESLSQHKLMLFFKRSSFPKEKDEFQILRINSSFDASLLLTTEESREQALVH